MREIVPATGFRNFFLTIANDGAILLLIVVIIWGV